MLAGEFTRFDVFSGPIKDNKGKVIVPAGEKMEQADIDSSRPVQRPVQELHVLVGRRHHRRTAEAELKISIRRS